jgi:hypothetical protein
MAKNGIIEGFILLLDRYRKQDRCERGDCQTKNCRDG